MQTTERFTRDWLPCLGVTWHHFETQAEAAAFAQWAEETTKHDHYPCEAFIGLDDYCPETPFEVKVSNW